jgi:predicted CXXCH cytochrome family protein
MDIMKPAGGLAMARRDESCAQCHRAQTRPFVFEHDALREGCVTCHEPHGSINTKMLTESDPNLCLRCHAQTQNAAVRGSIYIGNTDHTGFLRMGTCWTAGCHVAVHGSNVDPRLRY